MSKTNEKGPKKVDKGQYKDLQNEQAQQHANFIANSKVAAANSDTYNASSQEASSSNGEAWRKNFGSKDQRSVESNVQ